MHNSSYIAEVHPCPECLAPVANVARRCQHCGTDQPNVDRDGYRRMAEAFSQTVETAKDGHVRDDHPLAPEPTAPGRFPLKRFALRFRTLLKTT